ncbi:hypothetical protein TSTA_055080 [Talaromyces stipitatus ATCC 10500]|uniref:Cupin type-1 domain-containing protein n=1 Tax=Talaromyces stipitatus (strain ATCC 10500 / CBS 375.48 / QM 6759 / NRRL 1006) TaxID=441959 RepID=B8MRA7_TALSN|nr:uncharacterized protein TSTA_055080 [Talaromyces stipitatus ATCC 10500]EED13002.1 hypothetical protein TSTA_055080 [Talaromyces stipitatus ATCC 10500]
MFTFLRGSTPPKTFRAHDNPIYYEDGTSFVQFNEAGSKYILRNQHPPFDSTKPSIMTPPFHWHINQTEHFSIVEGECHLFKENPEKPWMTISAKDPNAPKTASIPKTVFHTIHNASTTEPMVVDVNLTPEDAESEQKFFRNFFGYLDDCRKAGVPPSMFQLFVFLNEADTPVAVPLPSKFLSKVASRVMLSSVAWYGRWILGYKTSYPEYYDDGKSSINHFGKSRNI